MVFGAVLLRVYNPLMYRERLKALLTPAERKIFVRLTSPQQIQNFLDNLPINFELKGETYMSPRRVLRAKTAHCFEGALFAAAVLAYHAHMPLLMDIQTIPADEDHVIALFRQTGRWGSISKTNHTILRYRDPVYASPRELAMSYFHEYIMNSGRRSMLAFSAPFDLSRYAPERWVTAPEELDWLVEALDNSRHFPIAPKKNLRLIRKATPVERQALNITEWHPRGTKTRHGK